MKRKSISRLCATAVALFGTFAFSHLGFAQTVNWGVNGAGGSGTWDTTTADWYNGTTNVPWPSGGNAVFAGPSGGAVNVFGFPVVSSMTFNTTGYTLQGGIINSSSGGLTVTTNADATIGTPLTGPLASPGNLVTKNGLGTLTLTGSSTFMNFQLNQGQLYVGGSAPIGLSNVTLANAPGVVLTLAPVGSLASIGSLVGGGSAGGLVQPADRPGTVTLSLSSAGNFGGTLTDNGAGALALDYKGTGSMTLTGVNTYTGATTIESQSVLALSGNGSATSTNISIAAGATLDLNDSGTVVGNRLSTTAPLSIDGGNLRLDANATTPVNEHVGPLMVAGASQIIENPFPSPTEQLSATGLTRVGHGVLNIDASNVTIAGLTNGSTGIVAPYIIADGDWATVTPDGHVTAFTAYVPDINAASSADNVQLISSGTTTTLAAPTTVGSLNLQGNPVLDLGGRALGLTSGGILSDGSDTSIIQNGSLSTPSGEFVVTTYNNNLTINANIVDAAGGTALTKAGSSVLTLTGNNTYTGTTSIMQGKLVVSADANLGLGTTVHFDHGTLQAAGSFASAKGIDTASDGGTINTGGFNVEFSGPASGVLTKSGLGTLTLDNATLSTLTVTQGLMVLPHGATSTDVNLNGANLQASGTVGELSWLSAVGTNPISTLDIGGPAAATLVTGGVSFDVFGKVQIDFGLGSTQSDFWSMTPAGAFWPTATGSIQFEFQNLGGLTTGVDYPLISFPVAQVGSGPPSANVFALAPDLIAAGWSGTFTATSTGVSVEFSRVPEPSGFCLIAMGIAVMAARRRRG